MSKKDFIALADALRGINNSIDRYDDGSIEFNTVLTTLANFCQSQNPRFMRQRWLDYIAGECGPNGGAVKKSNEVR